MYFFNFKVIKCR